MSFLDADTSNRNLPLSDISNSMNLSSNNSTLNNTEAKKIAALARHHRFQAEVTPRTAIRNFVEANQSEAQTPSNFFSQNPDSEVRSGTRRSLRQNKNSLDEATNNTITEADNSNLPSDGEPRCVSWKCSQHHHLDTFLTILHYRGCYGRVTLPP